MDGVWFPPIRQSYPHVKVGRRKKPVVNINHRTENPRLSSYPPFNQTCHLRQVFYPPKQVCTNFDPTCRTPCVPIEAGSGYAPTSWTCPLYCPCGLHESTTGSHGQAWQCPIVSVACQHVSATSTVFVFVVHRPAFHPPFLFVGVGVLTIRPLFHRFGISFFKESKALRSVSVGMVSDPEIKALRAKPSTVWTSRDGLTPDMSKSAGTSDLTFSSLRRRTTIILEAGLSVMCNRILTSNRRHAARSMRLCMLVAQTSTQSSGSESIFAT